MLNIHLPQKNVTLKLIYVCGALKYPQQNDIVDMPNNMLECPVECVHKNCQYAAVTNISKFDTCYSVATFKSSNNSPKVITL